MKNLNYSMYGSYDHKDYSGHPQEVMKNLGITYKYAVPQSLYDSWWFFCCENIPKDLPDFIKELKHDPIKCIGYGLSKEMAEDIVARQTVQEVGEKMIKQFMEGIK